MTCDICGLWQKKRNFVVAITQVQPLEHQSPTMTMKKFILILLATLTLGACQQNMAERAERDAREATAKRCPMRLTDDGSVILERIVFDKATLTWQQDYLLDVDTAAVININEIRDMLLKELRNMPSYKPYMEHEFLFRYIYCRMKSPNDTVIDITLAPKDYK